MHALMKLHDRGQRLWIEDVTRETLGSGLFRKTVKEWSVSGLAIGPAACAKLLRTAQTYDSVVVNKLREGIFGQALALDLIVDDTRCAADLLRPIFDRTDGMDGWAIMPMSPLLVVDSTNLVQEAKELHARVQRPNILISIPGSPECRDIVEEAIFAGVPLNVSLLFSPAQYLQAAEGYLRGIERRIGAGYTPVVGSFASIPVAVLLSALLLELPPERSTALVRALARKMYLVWCDLQGTLRWKSVAGSGARAQSLFWANALAGGTNGLGTVNMQDLVAPDTVAGLTVDAFAALAAEENGFSPMTVGGDDGEELSAMYSGAEIDFDTFTARLQKSETAALISSWIEFLDAVARRSADLAAVLL